MQRFFYFSCSVLIKRLFNCPPKEAAKPTLMPRAQSYRDLTSAGPYREDIRLGL